MTACGSTIMQILIPTSCPVATHTLRSVREDWVTVPQHHAELWQATLNVEQRPLQVYEEATTWN